METLIIKLGATGDVVRTTPLLRRFDGPVTWLTAPMNVDLLEGISGRLRCALRRVLAERRRDKAFPGAIVAAVP